MQTQSGATRNRQPSPKHGHRNQRASRTRAAFVAFLAFCTLCASLAVPLRADAIPAASTPEPIGNWWGQDLTPPYIGAPATAHPVAGIVPPQHPFMAATGSNMIHVDSYASDVHAGGPLGVAPAVTSASFGGECPTVTFDRHGRIVTVCGAPSGFTLRVLDPTTFAVLAAYDLGQRASTIEAILTLNLAKVFTDFSGAYVYLDNQDRIVVVAPSAHLLVVAVADDPTSPTGIRFRLDLDVDLSGQIERNCVTLENLQPTGRCDAILAVMPDWHGRYWWISRDGVVGTVDRDTHAVRRLALGEGIGNSFATAPDGVYVVTDYAQYALDTTADGTPQVLWREAYDRGTAKKPSGQNQFGSGTTPTLIGDDLVAITDNADPMRVVVYDRRPNVQNRLVCTVPVFTKGHSATDNSLIGFGNSIIVTNNDGYTYFTSTLFGGSVTGGIARVDVRPDRSGCDLVWTNPTVHIPSVVPKLSRTTGLVYAYTKDPQPFWTDAWYLTAIDVRTGLVAWSQRTGTGVGYDNSWAAITLAADGTAYVGVLGGIVAVRDRTG